MRLTRPVLGVAGVPLLSGCLMLGGMGHTGDGLGVPTAIDGSSTQLPAPLQRAEASSGSLTLALSFATPRSGAAVAIDAQLRADSAPHELTDGNVWLRIHTPGGSVDQFRMQRVYSSTAGTYQAQYRFPTAGLYLVTAEGRTGMGADVRTVLVTAEVEVSRGAQGDRHDWLAPVRILSSLGMVVTMALMMAGSGF